MSLFQQNVSLKPYNTFGIEAKATAFFEFTSLEALQEALSEKKPDQELLILGGGSNLLLTQDFEGLVLKNGLRGISLEKEDDEHIWVRAMAGENWHGFVMHSIEKGCKGHGGFLVSV